MQSNFTPFPFYLSLKLSQIIKSVYITLSLFTIPSLPLHLFSYHLLFSFTLSFSLPLSVTCFPYTILLIIINININMFIRIFRSNDVTNSNLKGLWLEIGIVLHSNPRQKCVKIIHAKKEDNDNYCYYFFIYYFVSTSLSLNIVINRCCKKYFRSKLKECKFGLREKEKHLQKRLPPIYCTQPKPNSSTSGVLIENK